MNSADFGQAKGRVTSAQRLTHQCKTGRGEGMFNLQDPFFRPLWLRTLIFAVCIVWAGFEYLSGSLGWALLFAGIGGWCAYQFFIVWTDPDDDKTNKN